MTTYMLADSAYETLHQFVRAYKVHPILVNFTAALIPVAVASDILARVFGKQTLRDTGWWTLCFAAIITPFTAIAGWLFWMEDDNGVTGMAIHKWLGTTLAVLLVGLVVWRWWFFKSNRWPSIFYLLVALAVVGAVVYQGHLGGDQSFGSVSDASAAISSSPSATATSRIAARRSARHLSRSPKIALFRSRRGSSVNSTTLSCGYFTLAGSLFASSGDPRIVNRLGRH